VAEFKNLGEIGCMQPFPLSYLRPFLAALAVFSLTSNLPAADNPDPNGTWTWTFTTPNGDTMTSTLKLKAEGDKLTGVVTGRSGNEVPIHNGKFSAGDVAFQVVRERDGNKFTTKYNGKLSGDSIKGKMEFERDGETRTRDWEARRKDGKSGATLTGSWKYSFTTSGGQTLEPTLKLKQDGEKLEGVVVFGDNERAISDGKVSNDEFSFKVVRERDGETFTSKYQGKLQGESLKGKVSSNWGGTDRTYDLDAKRVKE
jgi:hypothetical protein